ncbi:hypothetical protein CgunFtcFv8_003598 [Champsocephalus gunnari]|uniref:Uncharacterized protein n=1 Tax=Champsocephalus gunnari TaxID=52237 RepID=A0AAN8DZV1_CHAGU|nr:hypothetical protein CgunFtcFv8_003598 [Champsocephalus gunnari]
MCPMKCAMLAGGPQTPAPALGVTASPPQEQKAEWHGSDAGCVQGLCGPPASSGGFMWGSLCLQDFPSLHWKIFTLPELLTRRH